MENKILQGKVALITGSARGLGYSYAKLLAEAGATVIINDILKNESGQFECERVAAELNEKGFQADFVSDSVSEPLQVKHMVDYILEKYQRINILIHNAGNIVNKPFLEHTEEDWKRVVEVHLNGAFYLLKNICPVMVKQNYGRIVLVTSSMGMYGALNCSSYGAAKMGIWGLTKTIDNELAQNNIICNAISPLAKTDLTKEILNSPFYNDFTCDKVAALVLLLCSDVAKEGGNIYSACNDVYSKIKVFQCDGLPIDLEEELPEQVDAINGMQLGKVIENQKQLAKRLFKESLRCKKNEQ